MENFKINLKNVNGGAISVCKVLQIHGFQSYIVGGCVRDLLLGVAPKDWDITSDASPEQVMSLFSNCIPTGIQHGTVTVPCGPGVANHFEVTTFRTEGEYLDGRRPESVVFVKDVKEDLARRDLTINAIAFDPFTEQLVDPFDGIGDLQNKIIKAVGDPDARFKEDGLRIMRVARFAARFGYEIEEKTFQAMKANLSTLKLVSKERVRDELCKTLMTKHAFYGLNIMKDTGILHLTCRSLMGDFDNVDFITNIHKCSGDLETKIAFMYHNTPKDEAEMDFNDLKFSSKEIKRILFQLELLRLHKINLVNYKRTDYVQFISFIKNQSPDAWEYTLNEFISLTEALDMSFRVQMDKYYGTIVLARRELKVNGNDLIGLGVKPGPEMKKILDDCYQEVLKAPQNNNLEYLSKFALTFNQK